MTRRPLTTALGMTLALGLAAGAAAQERPAAPDDDDAKPAAKSTEKATFGGGCFWCLDAVYRRVRGVLAVESGYTGGDDPAPSYESVCTGTTGHAEAVRVRFDAAVVPPEVIMDLFFTGHDPTSLNRQGADVGTQYRSAVFAHDEAETSSPASHNADLVLQRERRRERCRVR